MAIGLYSNCRKKPYKDGGNSKPPVIGGYGIFRGRFDGVGLGYNSPWATIRSGTISEIVANTVYATSALDSDAIDTRDVESSGSVVAASVYIAELRSTHGYCGISFYDSDFYGLQTYVASGSLSTHDAILASESGGASGISIRVVGGFSATGVTVRVYIDSSLTDTKTISSSDGVLHTFSVGSPAARKISKLTVTVTNNEAVGRDLTMTAYSSAYGAGGGVFICGPNGGYPYYAARDMCAFYACHLVHDWDASDYSGSKYRTGSTVTSGTGSSYLSNARPLANYSTSFMTAATTATHTYEVDELSYAWVS